MKATKFIVFACGIILTILVPIIGMVTEFSSTWKEETKFQIGVSIGILLSTIIATYISVIIEKMNKKEEEENIKNQIRDSAISNLTAAVKGESSLCFAINKKQLYSKLNELVLVANEKLELMYLGDKPPHKLEKLSVRDKYIEDLDKIINDEKLHIKRVILYSAENKSWIREIANKYHGKRFFSLYIIETILTPSLSIQIIDSDKAIVINVAKDAGTDNKHIFIDSPDLNLIFHGFYKNVITNAKKIIENGQLDTANFNKYLK